MRVHSIAHRICTHTRRSYSASVIVGKVRELSKLLNVSITKQSYDVQVKCTDDIVTVISDNCIHTHSIHVELVSNAINHLKLDKNDCVDGLSSNNLKNVTHL